MWDKIKNIYEDDDKVKKEQLQTHRRQFEGLKVKDEENVASYLLHVGEIVNTIRGLSEIVEDFFIVKKIVKVTPLKI